MAMSKAEIQQWLDNLPEDVGVGINEDGLTLQVVNNPDLYLEVGGLPEDDGYDMEDDSEDDI
jgi:hypothetical protein